MVTALTLSYEAEGMTMMGHFAAPDGEGTFPAVLVAHGAPGLDSYCRTRPEALAECGFAALAIDYHGNGRVLTDPDELSARLEVLSAEPTHLRNLASAGLDALLARDEVDPDRVGALGYCFGSAVVMELARTGADLKAVVGMHPGLWSPRPQESRRVTGRVLMCIGADDPLVTVQDRTAFEDEMRAAGVDWQINLYGGAKHRFTDPNAADANNPALEYNPRAAERSWESMLGVFNETIR